MKYKNDRNNNWTPNKPKTQHLLSKARCYREINAKYWNILSVDIPLEYNKSILRIIKKTLGSDFIYIERIIKSENLSIVDKNDLYKKWAMDFSLSEILEDMRTYIVDFDAKYRNLKLNDLLTEL